MIIMIVYENLSLQEQLAALICAMWSPDTPPAERRKDQIVANETFRTYLREVQRAGRAIQERLGVTKVADITPPMLQWHLEKMRRDGRSCSTQYKACAAICKALQLDMGCFDTDRHPHNPDKVS